MNNARHQTASHSSDFLKPDSPLSVSEHRRPATSPPQKGCVSYNLQAQDNFEGLGTVGQPVHLTLDLKVPPRHAGIHRVPVLKLEKVKVKFDDMVKCGKLKKADQPTNWRSNMTVRENVLSNGTTEVCLDPSQTLNKAMIILGYQIPTIQEILPRLSLEKHKNFSIFNTLDGLTQVVLTDESSLLTTPWGRYC